MDSVNSMSHIWFVLFTFSFWRLQEPVQGVVFGPVGLLRARDPKHSGLFLFPRSRARVFYGYSLCSQRLSLWDGLQRGSFPAKQGRNGTIFFRQHIMIRLKNIFDHSIDSNDQLAKSTSTDQDLRGFHCLSEQGTWAKVQVYALPGVM